MKLKKCPCGATPKAIGLSETQTHKWIHAYGSCCGSWSIEVKNNKYLEIDSPELMKIAILEWNNSPRSEKLL